MAKKILDKSAHVIAIDSSGAARQLLTESIRQMGFENVQGIATVKDTIAMLETDEQVDWIVTNLSSDAGSENGLALLKMATIYPQLKHIDISMFIEEEEKYCLNTAFELGLLSFHIKPFNKDSLGEEWKKLFEVLEQTEGEPALVAASYLRDHLKSEDDADAVLALEKTLLEMFPASAPILLNLADAQFIYGDVEGAKSTLRQVEMVDPGAQDAVKDLMQKYLPPEETLEAEEGAEAPNILGIETVVLVDPDGTITASVEEIFKELGVPNFHAFSQGDEAAQFISENPNPNLIIQEWRIPKLTGPLFLQKVLSDGAPATPIIVLSSLIQKEDMPLIKEMGVANLVSKPFDKSEFIKQVIWTIQQDRSPTDQATMERKILSLLKEKNTKDAQQLMAQFLVADMPEARKKYISGEWAYFNGDYQQSRDDCIEGIKAGGESIQLLNLLGKNLMMLQAFQAALKCMKKAQDLSPQNIERLCAIAEAHTELGDEKAAEEAMNEAKDIDPDSKTVEEAEVKLALTSGDTEKAKALMGQLQSLDNMVAYMNNKAVAFARSGFADESIDQYRKAIKSLPDDKAEIKSLVFYNLALAYARSNELEEAKLQLERAMKTPHAKIAAKGKSLKDRIEKSLANGGDFQLIKKSKNEEKSEDNTTPEEAAEKAQTKENENLVILKEIQATRGEIGCYLVYQCEEPDEKSQELLKELPKFVERDSIEREESFGTEKSKAG